MNKETLCAWVNELKYVEVFEELDTYNLNSPLLAQLRNECIAGKMAFDFPDRLKIFIATIYNSKIGKEALTVFVLTGTKSQIAENGKKHNFEMPLNRYHETDLEGWQPFESAENVKQLFAEYKDKKGFPLHYSCLHTMSCGEAETRNWLREICKDTVLWVDLLAINENNENFISYFNHSEVGGLLTSTCLTDSKQVKKFASVQIEKKFINRKDDFENYTCENHHVALGVASKEWLFRVLTNIAIKQNIERRIEKPDTANVRNTTF